MTLKTSSLDFISNREFPIRVRLRKVNRVKLTLLCGYFDLNISELIRQLITKKFDETKGKMVNEYGEKHLHREMLVWVLEKMM